MSSQLSFAKLSFLFSQAIIWEKGVKSGKLTPSQFVAATSSNAAKIFSKLIHPSSDAWVIFTSCLFQTYILAKERLLPAQMVTLSVRRNNNIAMIACSRLTLFICTSVWGRNPKVISAETHNSAVDFNIFEGTATEFNPLVVISNGRVVLDEDGKLHVIQGIGRFLPSAPFAPHVYARINARELNMGPIKVDRSVQVEQKPIASGDARNGAQTPKKVAPTQELTLDTQVSALRISEQGPPSPAGSTASGSMTPTGFHKIHTRSGIRSQQDSGFKISGEQIDDDKGGRTAIKVNNPPGGKSSGSLW